jgi:hypothetical protein
LIIYSTDNVEAIIIWIDKLAAFIIWFDKLAAIIISAVLLRPMAFRIAAYT